MSEWQPIETAPRDGTEIQAWCVVDDRGWWEPKCKFRDSGGFAIWGRIDYDQDGWDWCLSHVQPTHWMPLPEPPSD